MKFSKLVLLALLGGCSGHASHFFVPLDEDHHGQFLSYKTHTRDSPSEADHTTETPIARDMPLSVEVIIAGAWICMVCIMPLVAARADRKLTKTQMVIAAVMLLAFLGGICLFTNLIYFKSVHFEGIRSLTIVECVYLMAQILTTVGYGDIVPARPRAQVFVALYVVFSILLIANTVSQVANYVAECMVEAQSQVESSTNSGLKKIVSGKILEPPSERSEDSIEEERQALAELLVHKSPPLPWSQLIHKFLGWAFFVSLGIVFYSNFPGENKNVWQSFYFSIITLSTVGFGAFTPLTPGGMVFGAFWMLFGSFSLLGLVGAFTQLIYALKSREKWHIQKSQVHEDELYKNLPDRIDAAAFVKFAVDYTSLVTAEELDVIQGTFEELAGTEKESVTREQALTLLTL